MEAYRVECYDCGWGDDVFGLDAAEVSATFHRAESPTCTNLEAIEQDRDRDQVAHGDSAA